jgi:hypothetical protein
VRSANPVLNEPSAAYAVAARKRQGSTAADGSLRERGRRVESCAARRAVQREKGDFRPVVAACNIA